jgi:hypothetical protein
MVLFLHELLLIASPLLARSFMLSQLFRQHPAAIGRRGHVRLVILAFVLSPP